MIFNSINLSIIFEGIVASILFANLMRLVEHRYENILSMAYALGQVNLFKILYLLSNESNKQVINHAILPVLVKNDDAAMLRFLLKNRFDLNIVDDAQNTLLMLALMHGSHALIDQLLFDPMVNKNLDVLVINTQGHQALSIAIQKNFDINIITQLLALGADPNHYDMHEEYHLHPVTVAIVSNNQPLLDALLKHESFIMTPELTNELNNLFLSEVPMNGYYAYIIHRYGLFKSDCHNPFIRKALYGDPLTAANNPGLVNEKDRYGLSAAHYAVILNQEALFKDLAKVPVFDVTKIESQGNHGLIELALTSGRSNMVKNLIQLEGIKMPGYFSNDSFMRALLENIQEQAYEFVMRFMLKNYAVIGPGLNEALNHNHFRAYLLSNLNHQIDIDFIKHCCQRFKSNKSIYGLYQLSIFAMLRNLCITDLTDLDRVIHEYKPNHKAVLPIQTLPHGLFMMQVAPYLTHEDHERMLGSFQTDVSRGTPV